MHLLLLSIDLHEFVLVHAFFLLQILSIYLCVFCFRCQSIYIPVYYPWSVIKKVFSQTIITFSKIIFKTFMMLLNPIPHNVQCRCNFSDKWINHLWRNLAFEIRAERRQKTECTNCFVNSHSVPQDVTLEFLSLRILLFLRMLFSCYTTFCSINMNIICIFFPSCKRDSFT